MKKNPVKAKKSWEKVYDGKVRTVWRTNDGELTYLYPCDIADTGVPINEDDGTDCEYVRTEVLS